MPLLAHDGQLDRLVALKIPKLESDSSGTLSRRFLREARSAATLSHPNICPIYDVGELDGRQYIAMAYIQGRPLNAYIKPSKRQPERQIASVIRKVALALDEAHCHNVLHRDLKPANIMIAGGVVMSSLFMVAILVTIMSGGPDQPTEPNSASESASGETASTPSPEPSVDLSVEIALPPAPAPPLLVPVPSETQPWWESDESPSRPPRLRSPRPSTRRPPPTIGFQSLPARPGWH